MVKKNKTPFITYELDKPRIARLTIGNMIKIKQLGIQLLKLAAEQEIRIQELDFPIEEMCKVFWVAFDAEAEELSINDVGDLIMEYSNLQEAMGKMFELINNSMPFLTGASEEELEKMKEEHLKKLEAEKNPGGIPLPQFQTEEEIKASTKKK